MGQRVRYLRKLKGLTQVHLAAVLGIDQSTVSDIENDRNDLAAGKALISLADVLGRDPHYITNGGPDAVLDELELLRAYRSASADDRAALLRMARLMAGQ